MSGFVNLEMWVSFAGVAMLELPVVTKFITHHPGMTVEVNAMTEVCEVLCC